MPASVTVIVPVRNGAHTIGAQLDALVWRLHAVRLNQARRDRLGDFWSEVQSIKGPAEAWRRTLSVLLRDPEMVGY